MGSKLLFLDIEYAFLFLEDINSENLLLFSNHSLKNEFLSHEDNSTIQNNQHNQTS